MFPSLLPRHPSPPYTFHSIPAALHTLYNVFIILLIFFAANLRSFKSYRGRASSSTAHPIQRRKGVSQCFFNLNIAFFPLKVKVAISFAPPSFLYWWVLLILDLLNLFQIFLFPADFLPCPL